MDLPYRFSEQELAWIQAFSGLIALLALLFSVLAVYFTARTFWQKTGAYIRGSYTITSSSIQTEHKFVHEILLENLKDRSVVIFGIYLRLSNGFMIEVETFDDTPFILKPFEVAKRTYDPVDFYSFNARRLNLNALFDNKYRKNRLVLSTPDGKLVVKKSIPTWNPVTEWFQNHLRITAHTQRAKIHGKSYGSEVLFVVDLIKENERIQSVPLYPPEFRYSWFRNLGGNEETLGSAESVEAVFSKAILDGKIDADRVEVIDARVLLEKHFEHYEDETIVAEKSSWFFVNVIGRIATWRSTREMERKNRETQRRNERNLKKRQETSEGEKVDEET